MTQFSVHRNANPESSAAYPYLLDIQSDLIADLATRVVVPLAPATAMQGKAIKTLMPSFTIDDERFVMVTPQLAGVAKKHLGSVVAELSDQRHEIISALDLLITGI
jgi:toxin CcdB